MRFYLPSKFTYFNENLHGCNGRRHATCSCIKCYVTCGHNTIYGIEDNYFFLGEYQIYFIECVENIRIFTSAQHK